MTIQVYAPWDFARITTGTLVLNDAGPETDTAVSFTSGVYTHYVFYYGETATLFENALATALNAATGVGAGTYTVAFNSTTLKYTISNDTANFSMTFTGAAGTVMQRILGFSGNKTGAATYTSDDQVYYAIQGTLGHKAAIGNDPIEYEADDIGEVGEADDGTSVGISRETAPTYMDFAIPWEVVEVTHASHATTETPWTWQHFFPHVRGHHAFLVVDSNVPEQTYHKLRKESIAWKPIASSGDPNDADRFNINLRTYLRGRV